MFTLGTKTIKQGRLILFKRAHYCLHITLQNNKGVAENFEIPIPFKVEYHRSQGLCYFDYRIKTLAKRDIKKEDSAKKMFVKNVSPSQYYNKILELTILDI